MTGGRRRSGAAVRPRTRAPRGRGSGRTAVFLAFFLVLGSAPGRAAPPVPFPGVNRSPLSGLFAPLPAQPPTVPSPGAPRFRVGVEAASQFNENRAGGESVSFDGETQGLRLAAALGLPGGWELGGEISALGHNGGVFDAFIEGWHRAFHLPQGGRDEAPHGRLAFTYRQEETERIGLDRSTWGLGDVLVWGGRQLGPRAAARGWLKLPAGRPEGLLGGGTVQAGLRLDAGGELPRLRAGWYAGLAAWGAGRGDVLPDRRRRWQAGATAGLEWSPREPVVLRAQLDAATPAFRSDARPLGSPALQLWTGGSLRLSDVAWLDLAVGEDVAVDTAPDVTFLAWVRWSP